MALTPARWQRRAIAGLVAALLAAGAAPGSARAARAGVTISADPAKKRARPPRDLPRFDADARAESAAGDGPQPLWRAHATFVPAADFADDGPGREGRARETLFRARLLAPLAEWGADRRVWDAHPEIERIGPPAYRWARANSLAARAEYRGTLIQRTGLTPRPVSPPAGRAIQVEGGRRRDDELNSLAAGAALDLRLSDDWRLFADAGGVLATDAAAPAGDGFAPEGLLAARWAAGMDLTLTAGGAAGTQFGRFAAFPVAGVEWRAADQWRCSALLPFAAEVLFIPAGEEGPRLRAFGELSGDRFAVSRTRLIDTVPDASLQVSRVLTGLGAGIAILPRLEISLSVGVVPWRRLEERRAGRRLWGGRLSGSAPFARAGFALLF
ncbi:MAG: hypothetical protein HY719_11120 [Planctomycetes bacterium]|nr:hypothetical protein [Planctomycetota bacterium]